MKYSIAFLFTVIGFQSQISAQIVPLRQPINTSLTDDFNPNVSGNGKTMIYEVVYRNTNKADVMITNQINGSWSQPTVVAGVNTQIEALTNGGYFINHAGNIILFHSNRRGGVGGTDIWYVEKNESGAWSAPASFGKPINDIGNEIDPSLSPDGKFLFFTILSEKKTLGGLPCGKIMMSERISTTTWKAPVELPAPINGGCECGGKLLSDNKTFLFSSVRAGGQGGYDFYKSTRSDDGVFSYPVNYTFINTPKDDKYLSVAAGGSMLYTSAPGKGKDERDIVLAKIPTDMQPEMVKLYQGKVTNMDTKAILAAQINVTHIKSGYTITYRTAADGSFSIPVLASDDYDIGVFAAAPGFEYVSFIDSTSKPIRYQEKNTSFSLSPLHKGSKILLSNINLHENMDVDKVGELELARAKLLIRLNPTFHYEILAYTNSIVVDSVRHSTLDIETTPTVTSADSTAGASIMYSNDHTQAEANVLYDYFIKNGIHADKISFKGMGLHEGNTKKIYVLLVK